MALGSKPDQNNTSYSQVPHSILMVRPASFGYNPETATSNAFQKKAADSATVQRNALQEFNSAVSILTMKGIAINVVDDTPEPITTDAIFPNNWITTHEDGKVILYPMMAPSRRLERRQDIVSLLKDQFIVSEVIDLSGYEDEAQYLEGTGSIIFDHVNRIAFACRSARTNDELFLELCTRLNYQPVLFDAKDESGLAIYHTNVMMWIGEKVAGICLEAIANEVDKDVILNLMTKTNHKVIALSFSQMNSFAGNMFEVKNTADDRFLLMSKTAYDSLIQGQLNEISKYVEPLPVEIATIEESGGGSIRCMVAGIHLPVR